MDKNASSNRGRAAAWAQLVLALPGILCFLGLAALLICTILECFSEHGRPEDFIAVIISGLCLFLCWQFARHAYTNLTRLWQTATGAARAEPGGPVFNAVLIPLVLISLLFVWAGFFLSGLIRKEIVGSMMGTMSSMRAGLLALYGLRFSPWQLDVIFAAIAVTGLLWRRFPAVKIVISAIVPILLIRRYFGENVIIVLNILIACAGLASAARAQGLQPDVCHERKVL